MIKPVAYSLQFRGQASSAGVDRLRFDLTAPSSALVTIVGPDGVRGAFEDISGGEARLEAELALLERSTFDDAGTIDFGRGHRLDFRSLAAGRLCASPDPNLRHGAVLREVAGGLGQFECAEGVITSNFLVSDTGEVTDNHFGLIFVHDRPSRPGGKGAR